MWRAGDLVDGMRIERVLPASGGRGVAYRAVRGGEPVFVKLFLTPRVPKIGSPALIARKREAADRFHAYQVQLYRAVSGAQSQTRGLCRHLVFLRTPAPTEGSFAVVNEWLDLIEPTQVQRGANDLGAWSAVLADLADALAALHAHGVVHGDVKIANVGLIAQPDGMAAKLFDYDHGYLNGAPRRGDFVYDPGYAAPEVDAHVKGVGSAASLLGPPADVFAFALVCAEILARRKCEASEAKTALAGVGASAELTALLVAALDPVPQKRPGMALIHRALGGASLRPARPAISTPVLPSPSQNAAAPGEPPHHTRPRLEFDD